MMMKSRVKDMLHSDQFRAKKRLSGKGYSSPFEIFAKPDDLARLFDENMWERGSILMFKKKITRLPMDYYEDDERSEEDVVSRRNARNSSAVQTTQYRDGRLH